MVEKSQTFKVGQAPQEIPSGDVINRDNQFASSLLKFLDVAGDFGDKAAKAYLAKQEEFAKKELANEYANNPTDFFTKFKKEGSDIITPPEGWSQLKWNAYNEMKGTNDAASIKAELEGIRLDYLNQIAADDEKSYKQGELDVLYQNKFDSYLRESNGNPYYLEKFYTVGTAAIASATAKDRKETADRVMKNFQDSSKASVAADLNGGFEAHHKDKFGKGKDGLDLPGYNFSKTYPTDTEAINAGAQWEYETINNYRNNYKILTGKAENGEVSLNLFKTKSQRVKNIWLDNTKTYEEKKTEANRIIKEMQALYDYSPKGGVSLSKTSGANDLLSQINNAISWQTDEDVVASIAKRGELTTTYNNSATTLRRAVNTLLEATKQDDGTLTLAPLTPDLVNYLDIDINANAQERYEAIRNTANKELVNIQVQIDTARNTGDTKTINALEASRDKLQVLANGQFAEKDNLGSIRILQRAVLNGTFTPELLYLEAEDLTVDTMNNFIDDYAEGAIDEAINEIRRDIYRNLNIPTPDGLLNDFMVDIQGDPVAESLRKLNQEIIKFYEVGQEYEDAEGNKYKFFDIVKASSRVQIIKNVNEEIANLMKKVETGLDNFYDTQSKVKVEGGTDTGASTENFERIKVQ